MGVRPIDGGCITTFMLAPPLASPDAIFDPFSIFFYFLRDLQVWNRLLSITYAILFSLQWELHVDTK
jgi:hypothetical protein